MVFGQINVHVVDGGPSLCFWMVIWPTMGVGQVMSTVYHVFNHPSTID